MWVLVRAIHPLETSQLLVGIDLVVVLVFVILLLLFLLFSVFYCSSLATGATLG